MEHWVDTGARLGARGGGGWCLRAQEQSPHQAASSLPAGTARTRLAVAEEEKEAQQSPLSTAQDKVRGAERMKPPPEICDRGCGGFVSAPGKIRVEPSLPPREVSCPRLGFYCPSSSFPCPVFTFPCPKLGFSLHCVGILPLGSIPGQRGGPGVLAELCVSSLQCRLWADESQGIIPM